MRACGYPINPGKGTKSVKGVHEKQVVSLLITSLPLAGTIFTDCGAVRFRRVEPLTTLVSLGVSEQLNRKDVLMEYNTSEMYLVYRDESGSLLLQAWGELVQNGTLIDPDTGDDLDIVGWTTEKV